MNQFKGDTLENVRLHVKKFLRFDIRKVNHPKFCLNLIYQMVCYDDDKLNNHLKTIRTNLKEQLDNKNLQKHLDTHYLNHFDEIDVVINETSEYEILEDLYTQPYDKYDQITRFFYLVDLVQFIANQIGQDGVDLDNSQWLNCYLKQFDFLSELYQLLIDEHCDIKKNGSVMHHQKASKNNIAQSRQILNQAILQDSKDRLQNIHEIQQIIMYDEQLLEDYTKQIEMLNRNKRRE